MASVKPRAEPEVVPRVPVASGSLRARTTIPAPPPSTVRRPGIEARLDDAGSRRLTLVSAGPGWGKTTTVAAWARSRPGPRVAWLTLEPFDDTPTAFWSDVLAALREAGAVPAGHPLAAITVPSRMSAALLRRILRGIEELPEPVVLVLDDVHHLATADVSSTVDDLLRYPLPLHVVVLTRIDPLFHLERLRGQGEVVELAASDLAFDATAVAALGALHGRALPAHEVEHLLTETGGWAVGVRLRVEAAPDATGRARAERSAAEFLLTEVLGRRDPVVRQFLLRTSVATTVCVELAETLDPGAPAGRLLPELAESDGFVTALGDQRRWYRYHPLLREMLQSELRLEDPGAVPAAHRAAARWLVRHGDPLRALEHAVAAEDWELAGTVFVEGAAVHLVGPHRQAVAEVLRSVPFADLPPDVALHLCAGSLALVDDRFEAADHHVARARRLVGDGTVDPVAPAVVLLGLLEASVARSLGDVRRQATSAGAALAAAAAVPFPFPALETYRRLALAQRTAALAWCAVPSDLDPVRAPTTRSPDTAGVVDGARRLVDLEAQGAVALLEVARGRLADGETLARAAVDAARTSGWETHVQARAAHVALVWAQYLRAHDDGLDSALVHALSVDGGGREPASEAAAHLVQSLLAASRGHGRSARQALVAADRALGGAPVPAVLADLWVRATTEVRLLETPGAVGPSGPLPPSRADGESLGSAALAAVCRARLHLAAGRTGAALQELGSGTDEQAVQDDLVRVEAALVEASALAHAGTRRADDALDRALGLAAGEGLVRPFLTVGSPELLPALARAVAHRGDALSERLRAHLPHDDRPEPAPLAEPLTERELSILAVLPTMESNVEIAEDFFVSVNTVKAHLKALYRKLGVGSRREAVRRGRELGILP
ncbi:LuxR C-terminal-related transcriptional regulator [Cellulosimicrobium sp. PMB13]|uniref:LuxR C-terminal-related transcriptional regulator n=1 Tax=Cellulosimicrobium sp. PMB13 TaxID=3120158 RepID=UPI003F4C8208